jgi:hypothetical protein
MQLWMIPVHYPDMLSNICAAKDVEVRRNASASRRAIEPRDSRAAEGGCGHLVVDAVMEGWRGSCLVECRQALESWRERCRSRSEVSFELARYGGVL